VVRRAALVVVLMAVALRALAKNEMTVDARTIRTNDTVTITIALEGPFAAINEPHVPLRNLRFLGEPSVSSEFAWINGAVSRRKTFRYVVRPAAPGPAQVGPIVLNSDDGQRDTLAAVTVMVQPDTVIGSNDPEAVLRELLAQQRAPMFVVAEVEKTSAYVGEPIGITWYLYNATAIQEWQVVSVPKLAEFWVEELTRGENAERAYLGDVMVQRLPIRRSILFPLRSGAIRVEGMTVSASILRRTRGGPFSMFEGAIVETTFTSAPFDLSIKPLPPGPPVDAVGNLALRCDPAQQRNAGPVVVRATLEGLGNLRATQAPRFERAIAGTVQTESGQVTVNRDDANVSMSRRWQFLIFPSNAGPLEIPALSMRVFVPSTGERRDLRCGSAFLDVIAAKPPVKETAPSSAPSVEAAAKQRWPWIAGALAFLVASIFAALRLRDELALRREVNAVLRDATPEEIRERVAARVRIDAREASDRGDAYRSLLSLLDAKERERDIAVDSEREIRQRVRELLRYRS
jgi:hypothetical protein